MLQGIVNLFPVHVTAHVQLVQVEQLLHLLAVIFTASPALTHHHLSSGTIPTHFWDGKGCYSGSKCCSPSRAPWFWKALPVEATSDIEVHWCQPAGVNDKTGIEQLEIYVF